MACDINAQLRWAVIVNTRSSIKATWNAKSFSNEYEDLEQTIIGL